MELILKDTQKKIFVSEKIFNFKFNEALIHQVVTSYAARHRQGTCSKRNRARVTGSNRKPWRQKGTGRARAGSRKSPIWRSGGITFAINSRDYSQKVNKKMYRGALKSVFSELIRQNRLILIENLFIEQPKTKILIQKLRCISIDYGLIIVENNNVYNKNLYLAARNLYKIDVCNVSNINLINLINFNVVVMTVIAIKQIEETLM